MDNDTVKVFLGYLREDIESGTWQRITIVYNGVEYRITTKDGCLLISADDALVVYPAASNMIRVKVDENAPGYRSRIPGDTQFMIDPKGGDE